MKPTYTTKYKPPAPYGFSTEREAKEDTDTIPIDVIVVYLPAWAREHKSRAYNWLYRKSWIHGLPEEFRVTAERLEGKWIQLLG